MSKGRMINGYWVDQVPATSDGTPSHWAVTRSDGTEVGQYPTYAAAEYATRNFLPG